MLMVLLKMVVEMIVMIEILILKMMMVLKANFCNPISIAIQFCKFIKKCSTGVRDCWQCASQVAFFVQRLTQNERIAILVSNCYVREE